jgi:hypothetical protein
MIELKRSNMTQAIIRAWQKKPKVRTTGWRHYEVVNQITGTIYHVEFDVKEGRKYGSCDCKAGQNGRYCYHLAGAAAVHLAIAKARSH